MKEMEYLEELTSRYPVLEAVKGDVLAAYEILRDCYAGGGKLMIAGNGGSWKLTKISLHRHKRYQAFINMASV